MRSPLESPVGAIAARIHHLANDMQTQVQMQVQMQVQSLALDYGFRWRTKSFAL